MRRTYYLESLGCIANRTDADRVRAYLDLNGYATVESPAEADVIVLTTCGYDRYHEDESIRRVELLQAERREGATIIVGGCVSGINRQRLSEVFEGPTFTPRTLIKLDDILRGPVSMRDVAHGFAEPGSRTFAVRVSTGCLHHCAFCAIPFANGRTMSRPIGDIVADLKRLEAEGATAFKLISEDVGAYGQDIGSSVVGLLEAILDSGIEARIYLEYMNLQWVYGFRHDLFRLFADERVGKHFYWPVQSGSDRILQAMARGYSVAEARAVLDLAFERFPSVEIVSDFMVGFPGETEEDFEATRALLPAYPFYYCNVFGFEGRPNTPATAMPDHVPDDVKSRRQHVLIVEAIASGMRARQINTVDDVVRFVQGTDGVVSINAAVV